MGRTTPRAAPAVDPDAARRQVEQFFQGAAERAYARAVAEHAAKMAAAEDQAEQQLRSNPEALGLPAGLPEFTIGILRRTMALDQVGPEQPDRAAIYAKWIAQ